MSIEVKNITKFYKDQKALNNVSFSIEKGEIVGFLGPNGAGKSTLMKIITGYINSFEGEVLVNDFNIVSDKIKAQKSIGYLPEHNPLYLDMFIKEYLFFNAEIHQVSKNEVSKIIEKVGLLPEAHKKINQLSKGYKQRVGLAAALLHNPEVLILDEPTTGMDVGLEKTLINHVKQILEKKTVIVITHRFAALDLVDRVIVLNNGKIVADGPKAKVLAALQQKSN